jgi:hypothetical protein
MKKILFILPFVLFIIMSCDNNDTQSSNNADIAVNDSGFLLTYKNDSISQRMRAKFINIKKISFTLTTINTIRNKQNTISGEAEMNDVEPGDKEQDTGEDGMAFFYDHWNYTNGKCQLDMRISLDSADYIRIDEFDCEKFRDPAVPFQTGGVLQRTDIKR